MVLLFQTYKEKDQDKDREMGEKGRKTERKKRMKSEKVNWGSEFSVKQERKQNTCLTYTLVK